MDTRNKAAQRQTHKEGQKQMDRHITKWDRGRHIKRDRNITKRDSDRHNKEGQKHS